MKRQKVYTLSATNQNSRPLEAEVKAYTKAEAIAAFVSRFGGRLSPATVVEVIGIDTRTYDYDRP